MVRDFIGVTLPRLASPWMRGVEWQVDVPAGDRRAFLTYDDGPYARSTPALLEALRQHSAAATFFFTGSRSARHPDLIKQILSSGNAIGLHGYDHLDAWTTRPRTILADYRRSVEVWRESVGEQPILYRPPFGHVTPWLQKAVRRDGGRVVGWDLMAWDFGRSASVEDVVRRVTRFIRPGSIIVLHETEESAEVALGATRRILEVLQAEGWRFPPLDHSLFST